MLVKIQKAFLNKNFRLKNHFSSHVLNKQRFISNKSSEKEDIGKPKNWESWATQPIVEFEENLQKQNSSSQGLIKKS